MLIKCSYFILFALKVDTVYLFVQSPNLIVLPV